MVDEVMQPPPRDDAPDHSLLEQRRTLQAAALQSAVVALTLSFQNAVAEQQQNQILRMALTTAAAKALLAGQTQEAEAVLKLAEGRLANPDLAPMMADLRGYLETVQRELGER